MKETVPLSIIKESIEIIHSSRRARAGYIDNAVAFSSISFNSQIIINRMVLVETALSALALIAVVLFQAVIYLSTHRKNSLVAATNKEKDSSEQQIMSLVLDERGKTEVDPESEMVAKMLDQTGREMLQSCRSLDQLVQEQLSDD